MSGSQNFNGSSATPHSSSSGTSSGTNQGSSSGTNQGSNQSSNTGWNTGSTSSSGSSSSVSHTSNQSFSESRTAGWNESQTDGTSTSSATGQSKATGKGWGTSSTLGANYGLSVSKQKRRKFTPDEVMLSFTKTNLIQLTHVRDQGGLLLFRTPYFADPHFRWLLNRHSELPSLRALPDERRSLVMPAEASPQPIIRKNPNDE